VAPRCCGYSLVAVNAHRAQANTIRVAALQKISILKTFPRGSRCRTVFRLSPSISAFQGDIHHRFRSTNRIKRGEMTSGR
jgi:hypothetical protein